MKIYLSPSVQENNRGIGNYGTEKVRMNELTDIIERELSKLITHIIVKDESQIESIVDYIMNESNKIFGYNVSLDLRKRLISRVSSFQRLSKDY